RLRGDWERYLEWFDQHLGKNAARRDPNYLPGYLRALGETGDLPGLVAIYQASRPALAREAYAVARQVCRLMVFAFTGGREAVAPLVGGPLAILPAAVRRFWEATAKMAAGGGDAARAELQLLLGDCDGTTRAAVEQRLRRRLADPATVLDDATRNQL